MKLQGCLNGDFKEMLTVTFPRISADAVKEKMGTNYVLFLLKSISN